MIDLFIHTSDNAPTMENTPNLNSGNRISEGVLNMLADIRKSEYNYVFIVEKQNPFLSLTTVGESESNDIIVIDDSNAHMFVDKRLNNVYLKVDDPERFYQNFISIYSNTSGFIDFKFKDYSEYDIPKLNEALGAIVDFMATNPIPLIVTHLNGYKMREKFNAFGESSFFVDTNGMVYRHPSFYYQKINDGCLGSISDFKADEAVYHFSKPHLACLNCETFYCDRNIFGNKIKTGEYMVPSSSSCAMTTLLSAHSKSLFKRETGMDFEAEELDKIMSFDVEKEYARLIHGDCRCNRIKNIDFSNRLLYGGASK